MMISSLYKHFQQKDSKFYLIDYIVHMILFMQIPQKEKLGFVFDALLLFYHKTTIGKNSVKLRKNFNRKIMKTFFR